MPNKPLIQLPVIFKNHIFTLQILQTRTTTLINMRMLTNHINTRILPKTHKILDTSLPNIYSHKCFNKLNLPFKNEVKKTEIGHLFEHILLEYISQNKKISSQSKFILEGKTSWDWKTDPIGVFHININVGIPDEKIVYESLEQSISLLKDIIASKNTYSQYTTPPVI